MNRAEDWNLFADAAKTSFACHLSQKAIYDRWRDRRPRKKLLQDERPNGLILAYALSRQG